MLLSVKLLPKETRRTNHRSYRVSREVSNSRIPPVLAVSCGTLAGFILALGPCRLPYPNLNPCPAPCSDPFPLPELSRPAISAQISNSPKISSSAPSGGRQPLRAQLCTPKAVPIFRFGAQSSIYKRPKFSRIGICTAPAAFPPGIPHVTRFTIDF